ncbi:hypothetical protein N0V84_000197 [Fusarium piperis]|uniref:Uncharacterized protein n=1 Tax=Fusarium piperis TaxID=1435070 RepID=A0A9W9BUY5_9HYPO|nr:hypothetical protein N0V84_000197 [Fusarium piperis]
MAETNESSQFLLQPLASATTSRRSHNRASDTDETHGDVSFVTTGIGGHDRHSPSHRRSHSTEPSPKATGLLIRDTTTKKVDESSSQRRQRRGNIFLIWSLELALLLLAAGLLASIYGILSAYNDDEVPNWDGNNNGTGGAGITLNALIAIIATIFRAILAFVGLQVLAQLKWDWVSASFRPMSDVQRFDDASRGAWGSLELLPLVALHQPLAVVAVIVVVVSLAVGPITQQTMQTYYCARVVEGRPAAISVANRIDETLYFKERPSSFALHVGLQSAMQDSIVNPSNDSNIAALFTCPSGNCTFTTYADRPGQPDDEKVSHASLGMCSRCEDVSELVGRVVYVPQTKTEQITVSLLVPTGPFSVNDTKRLEIKTGLPSTTGTQYLSAGLTGNLTWARKAVPREFVNTARWSAANFTILAFSQEHCKTLDNGTVSCPLSTSNSSDATAWGQPTDYIAAACIMYPCVKHYAGRVKNGVLEERVVKNTPLRLQKPESLWDGAETLPQTFLRGVQTPCLVNGTLYTSSNMTSASEKLPFSARETVSVLSQDWASEDLDAPSEYTNVTAPQECVASLWPAFVLAFQRELSGTFNAYCRPQGFQTEYVACFGNNGGNSLAMAAILRPRTTNLASIRENIDSMAMRITTEMRRAGWGPYATAGAAAKGDAWENRTCLHVAWAWFSLPLTLLVLCIVMISWIIVRELLNKDTGVVWKGSVLPFLLKDQVPAIEKMSMREMDVAAKGLELKLQKQG